jgi:uncharacterized membrane protein
MKSEENSKASFLVIFILTLLSISSLMMFLFIFEFWGNYKVIKHENEFKKIKVKIDSSKTSTSRSGKSSSSSSSTTYYFNKGAFLMTQDTKGILLNYTSYGYEINEYISEHKDSLNIWYLDDKTAKFAYEDQRKIDISEELENNKRVSIYFLLYVIFTLIVIKFRNQIFKKNPKENNN